MAAPNPHPDPQLFAQLFRLLSMYSLISTAKGSNVAGVENVQALLSSEDKVGDEMRGRQENFEALIDEILEFGKIKFLLLCFRENKCILASLSFHSCFTGMPFDELPLQTLKEHSYNVITPEKHMVHFMSGFTAFKQKKLVKDCLPCLQSLTKPREEANENDALVVIKEAFGGYTYASDSLAELIRAVETAVNECVGNHNVHKEMIFTTLKHLRIDAKCMVGCMEHMTEVTKRVLKFYLVTRMFFAGDMKNASILRDKQTRANKRRESKA